MPLYSGIVYYADAKVNSPVRVVEAVVWTCRDNPGRFSQVVGCCAGQVTFLFVFLEDRKLSLLVVL